MGAGLPGPRILDCTIFHQLEGRPEIILCIFRQHFYQSLATRRCICISNSHTASPLASLHLTAPRSHTFRASPPPPRSGLPQFDALQGRPDQSAPRSHFRHGPGPIAARLTQGRVTRRRAVPLRPGGKWRGRGAGGAERAGTESSPAAGARARARPEAKPSSVWGGRERSAGPSMRSGARRDPREPQCGGARAGRGGAGRGGARARRPLKDRWGGRRRRWRALRAVSVEARTRGGARAAAAAAAAGGTLIPALRTPRPRHGE